MRSSSHQRADGFGSGRTLRTGPCVWRLVIRDLGSHQKIMKGSSSNFSKQPARRENLKAPARGLGWRKSLWRGTAAGFGVGVKREKEANSFYRHQVRSIVGRAL